MGYTESTLDTVKEMISEAQEDLERKVIEAPQAEANEDAGASGASGSQ